MANLNEEAVKQELKELVRHSVEETLNNLPDQEAAELINADQCLCGRHLPQT